MAKILSAELGADVERLGKLVYLLFHFEVAEGVTRLGALPRQVVVIAGRGKLDGFHRQLGRRSADDDCQMIRRAGGGAEREYLLLEKRDHAVMSEDGGRSLVKK